MTMQKFETQVIKGFEAMAERIASIEESLEAKKNEPVKAKTLNEAFDEFLGKNESERKKGINFSANGYVIKNLFMPMGGYPGEIVAPNGTFPQPFGGVEFIQDKYPNVRPLRSRKYTALIPYNNFSTQLVGEGAVKPEANYALSPTERYVRKVAVRITLTEEQIRFGNIAEYIDGVLRRDLRIGLHINIINDIVVSTPLFNATPYANSVPQANVYDLIGKMKEQYFQNNAYAGNNNVTGLNFFTVSYNLIEQLKYIKDTTGNYVSGIGLSDFISNSQMYVSTSLPNDAVIGIDAEQGVLFLDTEITMKQGYATGDFESNRQSIIFEIYYLFLPLVPSVGLFSAPALNDIATINI